MLTPGQGASNAANNYLQRVQDVVDRFSEVKQSGKGRGGGNAPQLQKASEAERATRIVYKSFFDVGRWENRDFAPQRQRVLPQGKGSGSPPGHLDTSQSTLLQASNEVSLPSGPYSQEKLTSVMRQLKQMGMGAKDIYNAATEFEFLLYLSDSGKNV